MIIRCKIDCRKIDKARLYTGEKGTYLDCTLLENKDGADQYGNNFMIVQDVSKADREAGVKGAILGNAKFVEAKAKQPSPAPRPSAAAAEQPQDNSEIPF